MKKWFLMTLVIGSFTVAYADPMAMNSGCVNRSAEEQSFAMGMSAANQEMFCGRFNQDMRNAAMGMAGMPDSYGNVMTPDQSVEKVARDNNMNAIPNSARGGCPVK